jgi:transcriptional regulator with XRE-family HTH domain
MPMDGLAGRIRELRAEKGLTLKEVSERTGFSVGFLSQAERGLSSLSITSVQALAAALGVRGAGVSIHFCSRSLHTFENPTYEPTVAVWVLKRKTF